MGIIKEIEPPFGRCDQPDGLGVIYTSPDKAKKAFDGLYEKLCGLHPELIGEPEGLTMEDEVLVFKDCEIFTWQQEDF